MPLAGKTRGFALAALAVAGLVASYLFLANPGSFAHHHQAAQEAIQRRDFRQAVRHLDQCLEARPGDLDARLLAAQTARRQGDVKAAARHLQAYDDKLGSAEAIAQEHRLLRLQQGELSEADALLVACARNPESPQTPLLLEAIIEGNLRLLAPAFAAGLHPEGGIEAPQLARVRRAVDLWLEHRSGSVDQAQGLCWRGRILAIARDYTQARAAYRKALELDPTHFDARLQLALTIAQEAPQESVAHLEELLRRHPDDQHVRFTLATGLSGVGRLDEAQKLLDEVLAKEPHHVPALVERGKLALDAQQFAEAERWLRLALQQAPDEFHVNLALGECLLRAGNITEGKRFQERSQQIQAEQKRRGASSVSKQTPLPRDKQP